MPNKPMKPARAWMVVDAQGRLCEDLDGDAMVRVRILDDAAVKRAIGCLRGAATSASPELWRACRDAIRDLGGRP